jgi:hypothetical protein
MQFLLMLVSVGRAALDVRVTRIDEMGSERRSLGVKPSRKGVKHPQAVSSLSWKLCCVAWLIFFATFLSSLGKVLSRPSRALYASLHRKRVMQHSRKLRRPKCAGSRRSRE